VNGSKNRLGLLRVPRVRVSADGVGVLSHAGVGLLREVAARSGLSAGAGEVLADTYKGRWLHDPGRVFTDLAAAVADGADCVSGIGQLVDQRAQHGPVASVSTAWRLIAHRVDAAHLAGIKTARAAARATAWAAGAAPAAGSTLTIDIDATITIDHSDNKENAAATWKHTCGYHPLLAFLDRPDISAGEALAALLRPGNAGSNTAADPCHRAGGGVGRAAGGVSAGARQCAGAGCAARFAGAEGVGAYRFRRRHPRLRQDLPGRRCRILLRLHGHRTSETGSHRAGRGCGHRALRRDQCVGPDDQHRRHDPRQRLGRRSHRSGGSDGMAGRDPAHPAQGTPAPRSAAALHRHRRAPDHSWWPRWLRS